MTLVNQITELLNDKKDNEAVDFIWGKTVALSIDLKKRNIETKQDILVLALLCAQLLECKQVENQSIIELLKALGNAKDAMWVFCYLYKQVEKENRVLLSQAIAKVMLFLVAHDVMPQACYRGIKSAMMYTKAIQVQPLKQLVQLSLSAGDKLNKPFLQQNTFIAAQMLAIDIFTIGAMLLIVSFFLFAISAPYLITFSGGAIASLMVVASLLPWTVESVFSEYFLMKRMQENKQQLIKRINPDKSDDFFQEKYARFDARSQLFTSMLLEPCNHYVQWFNEFNKVYQNKTEIKKDVAKFITSLKQMWDGSKSIIKSPIALLVLYDGMKNASTQAITGFITLLASLVFFMMAWLVIPAKVLVRGYLTVRSKNNINTMEENLPLLTKGIVQQITDLQNMIDALKHNKQGIPKELKQQYRSAKDAFFYQSPTMNQAVFVPINETIDDFYTRAVIV